jgi:hypothetical protein
MPNVPALIGLSVSAAMTALQNVGLILGNVTVTASPTRSSWQRGKCHSGCGHSFDRRSAG